VVCVWRCNCACMPSAAHANTREANPATGFRGGYYVCSCIQINYFVLLCSYMLIDRCICKKIIYVMFFLVLQSRDAVEEKAQGSYKPSQQLRPTLENLKTVEIQIRHCPSDTRDQEISKLFSGWGNKDQRAVHWVSTYHAITYVLNLIIKIRLIVSFYAHVG
jgi:hypothetical protein